MLHYKKYLHLSKKDMYSLRYKIQMKYMYFSRPLRLMPNKPYIHFKITCIRFDMLRQLLQLSK